MNLRSGASERWDPASKPHSHGGRGLEPRALRPQRAASAAGTEGGARSGARGVQRWDRKPGCPRGSNVSLTSTTLLCTPPPWGQGFWADSVVTPRTRPAGRARCVSKRTADAPVPGGSAPPPHGLTDPVKQAPGSGSPVPRVGRPDADSRSQPAARGSPASVPVTPPPAQLLRVWLWDEAADKGAGGGGREAGGRDEERARGSASWRTTNSQQQQRTLPTATEPRSPR